MQGLSAYVTHLSHLWGLYAPVGPAIPESYSTSLLCDMPHNSTIHAKTAGVTPRSPISKNQAKWPLEPTMPHSVPYLAQYRHFGLFLGPKLTRRRSPVFQGRTAPEPGSAPGCRWAAHRLYGALLAHFARCGAGLLPVILPHILQVSARSTNGKAPSALLRGGFRAAKC